MKRITLVITLLIFCRVELLRSQWLQTSGPTSVHLNILALKSSDTIFAGTEKGVLRSTDGGDSWKTSGLANEPVNVLVCTPGGYVFAGTRTDVYRSGDGGLSWYRASTGLPSGDGYGGFLTALAVHPSGDLFAAMEDVPFGLYRSTDFGGHWSEVMFPSSSQIVFSISIDNIGRILLRGNSVELFRSTDRGATWTTLTTNFFPGLLTVSPDGVLYAEHWGDCAIFRSTDYGSTWDSVSAHSYVTTMIALNRDTLIGAVGLGKVVRSTDGAVTWSEIACWNQAETFLAGPGGIVFGGGHSIFRSTNSGGSWSPLDVPGWSDLPVDALAISRQGTLYAGGGSGLYSSTDSGNHWKELNIGGSTNFVYDLATNSLGHLFAVENYEGLRRSTDNGEHWVVLEYMFSPTIDAMDRIFAKAAFTGAIVRSIDNGESWDTVCTPPSGQHALDFAVDIQNHVFAIIKGRGIYRSTDEGATWDSVNSGLSDRAILHLATSPNGDIFAGTDSTVFRSVDGGANWSLQYTIPGFIAAMVANTNGDLFVASHRFGVYRNGTQINGGLNTLRCSSLALDLKEYLFVGTADNSVFRTVEPTTTATEGSLPPLPTRFVLEQNYPNPFNPTTTIQYALPHRSHVTLTVYNTLGQRVATLVNGDIETGYHTVQFDGSGLASGVYFYRLQAGSFVDTKKFLLVR